MLEAAGGTSAITVTTQPECAWTASTSANWISGLSPTSGQGNGSVSFRVSANDGASVREGTIVVNNEQARVSQRAPCRYTLTPASQTVATSGGAASVNVATNEADCAWTATTDASWISLTAPTSGTGPGVINFTVPPNTGAERTGSIIVAGQRAAVIQSAAPPPVNCSSAISPTSQNIAATGGPGVPIGVSIPATCSWSAQSNVPWITVTSGATGTGSGTVTFTVAANTGSARTGTITVAGLIFTVTQAAAAAPACTYSISPTSQSAPATATTGTVTVGFTAAPNIGGARSGTLTIAGQTFTVNQAAAVAPLSR
jgi:hypothetical protein